MTADREETRRDLAATVEARRELGPAYEDDLVQAFCDRIDATIERRVDERVDHAVGRDDGGGGQHFVLGVVSLGAGIPITAIAAGTGGTPSLIVAWVGIVGVNAAYAWGQTRRRLRR